MKPKMLTLTVALLLAQGLQAQHATQPAHATGAYPDPVLHAVPDQHDPHAHHPHHRHHLAVMTDATTNLTHHENFMTLGVDYEFRLSDHWGVGVEAEELLGLHNETVLGIPVFLHPFGDLRINAMPLVAFLEPGEESVLLSSPEATASESGTLWGGRVGMGYDLHLGKLSLTPNVSADFMHESTSLVYGLAFGVGF